MRRALAILLCGFAVLAPATPRADSGPVIAIPSRPGVPIIINGVDASYAVVEGDWGLSRPGHGSITVIGGAPVYDPGYRRAFPYYGNPPPRGRNEIDIERPAPKPAQSYSRSWSTQSDQAPATITDPATYVAPQAFGPGDSRFRRRDRNKQQHQHHHRQRRCPPGLLC